jgi:hypothetical protein
MNYTMNYTPDKWAIVKITGTDPHYRVFGSWSGGYLDGDSWRMNSGVVAVEEDGDYYFFKGHSGSTYQCHKSMYGFNAYGAGVAQDLCERSGGNMEILQEQPDILDMDWIIS